MPVTRKCQLVKSEGRCGTRSNQPAQRQRLLSQSAPREATPLCMLAEAGTELPPPRPPSPVLEPAVSLSPVTFSWERKRQLEPEFVCAGSQARAEALEPDRPGFRAITSSLAWLRAWNSPALSLSFFTWMGADRANCHPVSCVVLRVNYSTICQVLGGVGDAQRTGGWAWGAP